jgi:pyruvate/2-oxoglutarate dehydrogenase complex dihydrolipoamide dehydrogenase (E3) component
VAANLLDNDQRRVSDRIAAHALYTDPPLGRAGMTEAEVRKTGKSALISTMAMKDVTRAYERGETKGFNRQFLFSKFASRADRWRSAGELGRSWRVRRSLRGAA